MSPSSYHCGLYDELADDVRDVLLLFDDTHTTVPRETIEQLAERIILALRHDNPRFNEARFRLRITRP